MRFDSHGTVFDHEIGLSYETSSSQQSVFAETAPISIGTGENIMQVTNLIQTKKRKAM